MIFCILNIQNSILITQKVLSKTGQTGLESGLTDHSIERVKMGVERIKTSMTNSKDTDLKYVTTI